VNRTLLIGVAGGTGAGKTAIGRALAQALGGCVIDVDSYYLDRGSLDPEARRRVNYDEPAAVDATLLSAHLAVLAGGRAVERPVYSFETHTRIGTTPMPSAAVVIVDGLFTLWWEPVRTLLDLKVFVDAPADIRLMRRIRRDVGERGRTVEQVLEQYVATVRPMHDRYVESSRIFADVIVANDGPVDETVAKLLAIVRRTAADRAQTLTGAGRSKD
jgi:uridine kinase